MKRSLLRIFVLAAFPLLAGLVLTSCNSTSPDEKTGSTESTYLSAPAAPAIPTAPNAAEPSIPDPIGTSRAQPPTSTPQPLITRIPFIEPPPTHPVPNSASSNAALAPPNIAWGVETTDTLSIWVARYVDSPVPVISGARRVVSWNTEEPLKLLDLAVSPNHQSLAVLSVSDLSPNEGFYPTWLSVIDLRNNSVQVLPDDGQTDLYKKYMQGSPDRILGWLDNDRLAVLDRFTPVKAMIAARDGSSYDEVPFPTGDSTAPNTALSPDSTRFFSQGDSGFWLYNVDGSNPWNLPGRPAYYPEWSPNGRYISFTSPKMEKRQDGIIQTDYHKSGVWLIDLQDLNLKLVGGETGWNSAATWSPDGSKLAFLRADAPITSNDHLWYNRPSSVDTNVFVASISDLTPRKVTSFLNQKNSGLQWTPNGNLLFSSTKVSGAANGLLGLIGVNATTGLPSTLLVGSLGESLVHPEIFK